jgi:hypothetical protein
LGAQSVKYDTWEHVNSVSSSGVHSVNKTRRSAMCAESH